MTFILLCHYLGQGSNPIMWNLAQFFNIGVPIFFIISGYLAGIHGSRGKNWISWYLSRLKRIFVPYEIFLVILAVVTVLARQTIIVKNWLFLIFGFQGTNVGVLGAEQTWFISSLLICYSITPILSWSLKHSSWKQYGLVFLTLPLLLSFFQKPWLFTLLSHVSDYTIGLSFSYRKIDLKYSKKGYFVSVIIIVVSFFMRIIMRDHIDGTFLYDLDVVYYTHLLGAACITYIVFGLFKNQKIPGWIGWLDSISYEVYLVHYMFVVGPVRMFGLTRSWILNCIITTFVTLILAQIIYVIANRILHYNKIKYNCRLLD